MIGFAFACSPLYRKLVVSLANCLQLKSCNFIMSQTPFGPKNHSNVKESCIVIKVELKGRACKQAHRKRIAWYIFIFVWEMYEVIQEKSFWQEDVRDQWSIQSFLFSRHRVGQIIFIRLLAPPPPDRARAYLWFVFKRTYFLNSLLTLDFFYFSLLEWITCSRFREIPRRWCACEVFFWKHIKNILRCRLR